MSAWGPTCTIVASSTAGSDAARRAHRLTAPTRHEDGDLAAFLGEEVVGDHAARRAGGRRATGGQRGGDLPEGTFEPRPEVVEADRLGDRRRFEIRLAAVLDAQGGRRALEQVAEGGDGRLGLEEIVFQPGQVHGDELVSGVDVRRLQHGADLLQRHVEVTEAPDDLCGRDLLDAVTAVARPGSTSAGVRSPSWW